MSESEKWYFVPLWKRTYIRSRTSQTGFKEQLVMSFTFIPVGYLSEVFMNAEILKKKAG